jgi:hypothetical protein
MANMAMEERIGNAGPWDEMGFVSVRHQFWTQESVLWHQFCLGVWLEESWCRFGVGYRAIWDGEFRMYAYNLAGLRMGN